MRASSSAGPTVLVPVADGTEEMEAVIVIDVLRRASIDVRVAAVSSERLEIDASRGVKLVADVHLKDCVDDEFDGVILPGGMPGASHLSECKPLIELLSKQKEGKRLIGAICAAPAVVLETHGLLDGVNAATCHPGFIDHLKHAVEDRVVLHENVLTSRGPGTAFEFALAVVRLLVGEDKMEEVAGPMVLGSGWSQSLERII